MARRESGSGGGGWRRERKLWRTVRKSSRQALVDAAKPIEAMFFLGVPDSTSPPTLPLQPTPFPPRLAAVAGLGCWLKCWLPRCSSRTAENLGSSGPLAAKQLRKCASTYRQSNTGLFVGMRHLHSKKQGPNPPGQAPSWYICGPQF